MLIFSYRDEDADRVNFLFSPEQVRNRFVDLHVECLERTAVYHLVSASLGTSTAEVQDFSDVLCKKTAGNPFYLLQLMEHLKKEGLLTSQRHGRGYTWSFDADRICEEIQVSDSVAGLLARKAARLRPEVQEICKVESLLGFRFDEEVVLGIRSSTAFAARQTGPSEIERDSVTRMASASATITSAEPLSHTLATAVDEGLLERTRSGFRFEHDKVQSCFQSILTSSERVKNHKMIGEWNLHRGDPESLYAAANT
jgi:predicted ATPase